MTLSNDTAAASYNESDKVFNIVNCCSRTIKKSFRRGNGIYITKWYNYKSYTYAYQADKVRCLTTNEFINEGLPFANKPQYFTQ